MNLNRISDLDAKGTLVDAQTLFEIEQSNLAAAARSRKLTLTELRTEAQRGETASKSADYTITGRDDNRIILMTTGSSDRTVDLPDSSTDDVQAGDEFAAYKIDSGTGKLTLAAQGSDVIDGVSEVDCDSQYDYAKVRYIGSGVYVLVEYKDHGSNSDGHWQRFADGTMKQWNRIAVTDQAIDNAYGSLYQDVRSIAYPFEFVSLESFGCSEFKWGTGAAWGTVSGGSTSAITVRGLDILSRAAGTNVQISWHAEGRWRA